MPIPVRCPSCDHTFRVPDKFAGKRGKCPKCKSIFLAKAKGRDGTPDKAIVNAAQDANDETVAAGDSKTLNLPKPKLLSRIASADKDAAGTQSKRSTKTQQPKRAEALSRAPAVSAPPKEAPPKAEARAPDPLGVALDPLGIAPHADPLGITASSSATSSVYAHRPKKRSASPMLIVGGALVLLLLIGVGGAVAWSLLGESLSQMAAATGDSAEPNAGGVPAAPPPPPPGGNELVAEAAGGPAPHVRTVQDWDLVRQAVVTVTVIDRAGQTHVGRGVIIDPRGWVATSFTLIAEATDAHITLADDRKFQASGTLAKAPTGNLALLRIDADSDDFPTLKLNNRWLPGAHEIVFVGDKRQPLTATIEGAADWRSIPAGSRARLPEAMRDGDGVRLLVHSQTIDDELNGAPLLIVTGDVVGINIALGPTKKGYAVTASDIADMLADVAPNRIASFAKANPLPPVGPSIDHSVEAGPSPFPRFQAIVDRLAEMNWNPTTAQHYHDFQALAANVTEMQKLADAVGDDLPANGAGRKQQLQRAIDAALGRLKAAPWPDVEEMARINRLAISTISASAAAGDPTAKETGVYLFGKCVMRPEDFGVRDVDNLPGFAFEVVGAEEIIVMGIGKNGGEISTGEHCLILGSLALDETYSLPEQDEPRKAKIVRAKYLLRSVKAE